MLCGREVERAQIGALLEAARDSRSGALVVRGEPGIGKSALLEDARDAATDMRVLSAHGVESEAELPFGALHQLLRPGLDSLDNLPGPQAAALGSALGLSNGGGYERFLIFAGCLSLLSELAERRPVLCLVDDAHWLDDASADALRFVARRLHAEGIVILFGAREGDVRVFDAPDIPSLVLDGLDAEAAAALLARGSGVEPVAAVRDALVDRTGGNALALMEVPGALTEGQLTGTESLPDALPMSREVEGIFLKRVRRLPETAQRVLLAAAADDSGDVALVARVGEALGFDADALDPVERAGLVTVRGTRIVFRHPLVRSAVYDGATSGERRATHRALADVLTGDDDQADRRAWHLAASVLEHDDQVVKALDDAADRAGARGAHAAAARALERAAELSSGEERGRRLIAAAQCATRVGSDARAAALARQAQPFVEDTLGRAEIAYVLGVADARSGRPVDAYPLLVTAARDVASESPRQALELLMWSLNAAADAGDPKLFQRSCAQAAAVDPGNDESAAFLVDLLTGVGAMAAADPARGAPLLERAAAFGDVTDDELYAYWASLAPLWLGNDERLSALLDRTVAMCRERGAVGWLAEALGLRAAMLGLAEQFDAAAQAASEGYALATELGMHNRAMMPLAVLAYVNTVHGEHETALRQANEVLETATARGLAVRTANALHVLALIDLSAGRFAEALARFEAVAEESLARGDSFVAVITTPGRVEAAVRSGNIESAQAALPLFEAWSAHARVRWAPPLLAACRGLIAEGDEATAHFESAIELEADARPLDRGRIRLLYGEHLRRMRRRVDARVQLRAALEVFESHRAQPWADRTRAELRASGETARKRDESTRAQLTPQELQIAGLVAEGLSNKEVAAQLYLSPRTIDAHLRNVFSKLGITKRTQLARISLEGAREAVPA